MRAVLILSLVGLAGCGADGDPIRPEARTTLSIGTSGVDVSTGVTVRRGPVSVGLSL